MIPTAPSGHRGLSEVELLLAHEARERHRHTPFLSAPYAPHLDGMASEKLLLIGENWADLYEQQRRTRPLATHALVRMDCLGYSCVTGQWLWHWTWITIRPGTEHPRGHLLSRWNGEAEIVGILDDDELALWSQL